MKSSEPCAPQNLRCGSCLAQWNGITWEESYKSIIPIKSWTLQLNENFQLCVKGQCDVNVLVIASFPISNRLTNRWVTSEGILVKLQGPFLKSNVPDYVAEKFFHGFPVNWKGVLKRWAEFIQLGAPYAFNWMRDNDSVLPIFPEKQGKVSSEKCITPKTKESPIQRKSTEALKQKKAESNCATASKGCSQSLFPKANPMVCPWLPVHKVQAINHWINCSKNTSRYTYEMETDSEYASSFISPSASATITSRNYLVPMEQSKIQDEISKRQNTSNSLPLETMNCVAEHMNKFSICDVLQDSNKNTDVSETVFVKPKKIQEGEVGHLSISVFENLSKSADYNTRNSRRSQTQNKVRSITNSEIQENITPGMLSSLMRARRKQAPQRLERWRPVLGANGSLKVQGYLLFAGDMTAGHIFTTNALVKWDFRKVRTCNGREYELIGEPYGRIPIELKHKLLKPITREEIVDILLKNQQIKVQSPLNSPHKYSNEHHKDSGFTSYSRNSTEIKKEINQTPVKKKIDADGQGLTSVLSKNDCKEKCMSDMDKSVKSTEKPLRIRKSKQSLAEKFAAEIPNVTPAKGLKFIPKETPLRKSLRKNAFRQTGRASIGRKCIAACCIEEGSHKTLISKSDKRNYSKSKIKMPAIKEIRRRSREEYSRKGIPKRERSTGEPLLKTNSKETRTRPSSRGFQSSRNTTILEEHVDRHLRRGRSRSKNTIANKKLAQKCPLKSTKCRKISSKKTLKKTVRKKWCKTKSFVNIEHDEKNSEKNPGHFWNEIKNVKCKRKSGREKDLQTSDGIGNTSDEWTSASSEASDISIGPSASIVCNLQSASSIGTPRTLKERQKRDEQQENVKRKLQERVNMDLDDDPMAHLIASNQLPSVPPQWCHHENVLNDSGKRQRMSSSDGTLSPCSFYFEDNFCNWDATSSVASPQLIMNVPERKQIQSYLQRQMALKTQVKKSTRTVRQEKRFIPPNINYSDAFQHDTSGSEEEAVGVSTFSDSS